VGSPEVHQSDPVLRELRIFRSTGKQVIPINFNGSLSTSAQPASPLQPYLDENGLWIDESLERLFAGPSPETLAALRDSFDLVRQRYKRLRLLRIVASVLLGLSLAVVVAISAIAAGLPTFRIATAVRELKARGLTVKESKEAGSWHFTIAGSGIPITDWDTAGQHFAVLDKYGQIDCVDFYQAIISDLGPLASLRSVHQLKLPGTRAGVPAWSDLSPVKELTEVTEVDLEYNTWLQDDDLKYLQDMPKLSTLHLGHCTNITNQGLSLLNHAPIEDLSLDSCDKISLAGLLQLNTTTLRSLSLKGTSVKATMELVDFVKQCPRLKSLSVDPEGADTHALEILRGKHDAKEIDLDAAPVRRKRK
jgi:hypothetical protein